MRWLRTVGLCLVGIVLLDGCTRQKAQEPKAQNVPISDDALASYRKKHPEALIGRVVAIRSQDRLLAAGDLPIVDFKRGDAVVILGSSQEQIATGDVVSMGNNWIHVHYSETATGQREPQLGDLVVRFKGQ
jgi:hypothetical protein